MASSRPGSKRRTRLTKAEIKAYESRRAAERRRLALQREQSQAESRPDSTAYTIARDDEYEVIRADLIRLAWIVAVLVVLLVVATLILS